MSFVDMASILSLHMNLLRIYPFHISVIIYLFYFIQKIFIQKNVHKEMSLHRQFIKLTRNGENAGTAEKFVSDVTVCHRR